MEKKGARRIDSLGRIVLPMEIRKLLNINSGDYVEFFVDNIENRVIMKKYNESCIFCGSTKDLKNFGNKFICDECVSRVTKLR